MVECDDDNRVAEEAASRLELGIRQFMGNACPTLIAIACARVMGSCIAQNDTPEEAQALADECTRQIEAGIVFAQKMMAKEDGVSVDN